MSRALVYDLNLGTWVFEDEDEKLNRAGETSTTDTSMVYDASLGLWVFPDEEKSSEEKKSTDFEVHAEEQKKTDFEDHENSSSVCQMFPPEEQKIGEGTVLPNLYFPFGPISREGFVENGNRNNGLNNRIFSAQQPLHPVERWTCNCTFVNPFEDPGACTVCGGEQPRGNRLTTMQQSDLVDVPGNMSPSLEAHDISQLFPRDQLESLMTPPPPYALRDIGALTRFSRQNPIAQQWSTLAFTHLQVALDEAACTGPLDKPTEQELAPSSACAFRKNNEAKQSPPACPIGTTAAAPASIQKQLNREKELEAQLNEKTQQIATLEEEFRCQLETATKKILPEDLVEALPQLMNQHKLQNMDVEKLHCLEKILESYTILVREMKEDIRSNQNRCCVCQDRNKTVLLLPCKHLCMCKLCSVSVSKCPLCLSVIAEKVEAFV